MNFSFLFQILHEFSNNIFTWKLKISQCYWEIRFKLHMSVFKIPPIFIIVLWSFHPGAHYKGNFDTNIDKNIIYDLRYVLA